MVNIFGKMVYIMQENGENNLINGKGTVYYKNGNIHYEGGFIKDKYEGN